MRNKTILRFATAVLPLLLYVIATTSVHAKANNDYGPAVDDFCQVKNGQTPFAEQSCGLCHVSNTKTPVIPEWDWYTDGLYGNFCPDVVNNPPNGTITSPAADRTVTVGDTVLFQGAGSDMDGDTPLEYSWTFDGAAPASNQKDPGEIAFTIAGDYTVTLTVTDSTGLADPTPVQRRITAEDPPPVCTDADGDDFSPDGGSCGPLDCNDNNPAVNPSAEENCNDGIDNDCNGLVDGDDPGARGCPVGQACIDQDGDLFSPDGGFCGPSDCDDNDANVNPSAVEVCNDGFDNDCDGLSDGGDSECDGSDCITRLFGDDSQFRITAAVWRKNKAQLVVKGDEVPKGGEVLIYNGVSLELVGRDTANKKGIWKLTLNNPASVPCTVLAEYNGHADTRAVKNAPDDCDMGNAAPVAENDDYGLMAGNTLAVAAPGVLSNDSDADGDTLEAILIGSVDHGSLSLDADGGFVYQPAPGFSGQDGFTYQAGDGLAVSPPARVTLDVKPAPVLELVVKEVKWDGGKLKVKGANAPANATLEVLDADSNALLATMLAQNSGEFELEERLSPAPCAVLIRVQGVQNGPYPVEDAPCDGGGVPGGDLQVKFTKAEWKTGDKKLKMKGANAPSNTTIEILDADTETVLGSVTTEGDGKFEVEKKLSSAPCRIKARHNGKTSDPHPVEDAPCDGCGGVPGGDLQVKFTKAEWKTGDRKLKVKGADAPSNTTIEILNANTGTVLGSVTTEGDGKFEMEKELSAAPCCIKARHNGMTSDPHPVKDAPGSCG